MKGFFEKGRDLQMVDQALVYYKVSTWVQRSTWIIWDTNTTVKIQQQIKGINQFLCT